MSGEGHKARCWKCRLHFEVAAMEHVRLADGRMVRFCGQCWRAIGLMAEARSIPVRVVLAEHFGRR